MTFMRLSSWGQHLDNIAITHMHVFSMMGRFSRDGMMDFGSGVDPNKHGFQKFFAWL